LANPPFPPSTGWEQAWKAKLTPWDGSDVQPALGELIEERRNEVGVPFDTLKDGKALIAGCGTVRRPSLFSPLFY
jgi:hypothetical protein